MSVILDKNGLRELENGKAPDTFDQMFAGQSPIISLIREGANYNHEITINSKTISVRILETREEIEVKKTVNRKFSETPEVERFPGLYQYLLILHTLQRALTTKDGKNIVTHEELGMLSLGDLSNLYDKYLEIEQLYNPRIEQIAEDGEFDKWLDALKKKEVTKSNISHGRSVALNYKLFETLAQLMDKLRMITFAEDSIKTG